MEFGQVVSWSCLNILPYMAVATFRVNET